MTDPRSPSDPQPVGPTVPPPAAAPTAVPPGGYAPLHPYPAPDAPWFAVPQQGPGLVPPPPAPARSVWFRRVPGAVLAAAAAGILVLGGAGGFGLARATGPATTDAAASTQLGTGTSPGGTGGTGTAPGGTGTGTVPGGGFGGGFGGGQGTTGTSTGATIGTIATLDGTSFTLQTVAGQSVVVTTTDSTQVEAAAGNAVSALAVGDVVMVRGEAAQDGSVAATLVVQGELRGGTGIPGGSGSTPAPGTAPQQGSTDAPSTTAAPATTEGTTT